VDPLADRETVYELYYSIMVTPWLTITPDVQVITNPGGRNDARDALVGGLRIKLVF
jgi:porin